MPNFMSDEELGLSNGDLWECEHCGKVMSVDEAFHSCEEGAKASRKSAEAFNKAFVGRGKLKTRQFLVTIVAYDTEPAFDEAWSSMAASGPEQKEDTDEILGHSWEIKEVT